MRMTPSKGARGGNRRTRWRNHCDPPPPPAVLQRMPHRPTASSLVGTSPPPPPQEPTLWDIEVCTPVQQAKRPKLHLNATPGTEGGDASHAVTGGDTISCRTSEEHLSHATDTVTDDAAGVYEVVRGLKLGAHG